MVQKVILYHYASHLFRHQNSNKHFHKSLIYRKILFDKSFSLPNTPGLGTISNKLLKSRNQNVKFRSIICHVFKILIKCSFGTLLKKKYVQGNTKFERFHWIYKINKDMWQE